MAAMNRPPEVVLGTSRRPRPRWVPVLMAGAAVSLLAGLWSGLVLLGVPVPTGQELAGGHGVLMTLGFLGTLIALERAVALGSTWAYVAPAAAGAGGLAVVAAAPGGLGQALLVTAGLLLVANYVAVHRIQPSLHNTVLAAGAACWAVAAGLWLVGWEVPRVVPWLAGFLVLTIAGERLELSRMTGATARSRWLFTAVAGIFVVGLAASLVEEGAGVRLSGVGLVGLAAWLARYDIARRTIRASGLTRYMAVALLTGYGWLAVAGALWIFAGQMGDPASYGAMLHALFLGFVISMVFAHAPVIIPAVLGVRLPYHPILYAPLVLLHASLALRLAGGDAAGSVTAWQWGGVLNEMAILLFLALAAARVMHARRRPARIARPGHPLPDAKAERR
jgi:hypothetical protein